MFGTSSKSLFGSFQIPLSLEGLSVCGRCLRLCRLLPGFRCGRFQLLFGCRRFLTGRLLNALSCLLQCFRHGRVIEPAFMSRCSSHIRGRQLHILSQFLLSLFGCRQLILSRGQLTAEIGLQPFRRLLQFLQRFRSLTGILFGQLGRRVTGSQGRHGRIVRSIAILLRRLHFLSRPILLTSGIIKPILDHLPSLLLSDQLLLQSRISRFFIQLLLSLLDTLVCCSHFILNILHGLLSPFDGLFRLFGVVICRLFLLLTKCLPLLF